MLEHAYQSVRNVFSTTSEGKLVGGDGSLNQLESLPGHWPSAKLTLPLKFSVNRGDGLRPVLYFLGSVYEELLHAASQFNLSPTAELKRPTFNLVKIASHVRLFHPLFFHVWFNLGMRLFSFVVVVVFLLCLCFWFLLCVFWFVLLFVSHS